MVPGGRGIVSVVVGSCLLASVPSGGRAAAMAPQPVESYEGWSGTAGWRPLPAAPASTPTEAWRVELVDGATHVVSAGIVVVAEPAGDSTLVRRIDAGTGRDVWRTEVAGAGDVQIVVDPAGELLLVAVTGADGTSTVSLLGAGKRRQIWSEAGFAAVPTLQPFGPLALVTNADESIAIDVAEGTVRWERPYHKPGGLAMWRSDGRQHLLTRGGGRHRRGGRRHQRGPGGEQQRPPRRMAGVRGGVCVTCRGRAIGTL